MFYVLCFLPSFYEYIRLYKAVVLSDQYTVTFFAANPSVRVRALTIIRLHDQRTEIPLLTCSYVLDVCDVT